MSDSALELVAGSTETRMIAVMRLVLAASALLIISIDPVEPDGYVAPTYAILLAYSVYSAAIYGFALAGSRRILSLQTWLHWADIAWYLVLIALGSGANSIFFMFFFFSIVAASFGWGFRLGLATSVVSSALSCVAGYVAGPKGSEFALDSFLFRPVCLLTLGYMLAYRAERERTLRRRLGLLKEINKLSNPRFGIDRTLGTNMERLRAFYGADLCLTVFSDWGTGALQLRVASADDPEAACCPDTARTGLAEQLIAPQHQRAVVYARRRGWLPLILCSEYDLATGTQSRGDKQYAETLARLLGAESFIAMPIQYRGENAGRLYLASRRSVFRTSDFSFLGQAMDQIMPVLENIRLVDRLASTAADEERQRIARDIHDSVIQPYIGLQIGLSSVYEKLLQRDRDGGDAAATPAILKLATERIRRLIEMTASGVADLRGLVGNLKGGPERDGNVVALLRRFAVRFSEATGISTHVEAEGSISINDRLAAEVFHMVAEGLSNVRRHTQSAGAKVRLRCSDGSLVVRIENDGDGNGGRRSFRPRSIVERAEWLLGKTRVELLEDGRTAVVVEIPL